VDAVAAVFDAAAYELRKEFTLTVVKDEPASL
jgi:hypothetical protein